MDADFLVALPLGVFNTIGGAGESIRGNFNNLVDREFAPSTATNDCNANELAFGHAEAGEGLASQMGSKEEQAQRDSKLADKGTGSKPGENADVAQRGEDQVKQGINQLTGNSSSSSSSS